MSRKVKIDPKQGSLSTLFAKATPAAAEVKAVSKVQTASKEAVVTVDMFKDLPELKSSDPLIQAYYDQLPPPAVIANKLAVERLGSSYDVTRTHGFLQWSKTKSK